MGKQRKMQTKKVYKKFGRTNKKHCKYATKLDQLLIYVFQFWTANQAEASRHSSHVIVLQNPTFVRHLRKSVLSILMHREKMLEGKAVVKETDMPLKLQIQAMSSASQALDIYDVFDSITIASHIKKEFDQKYGSGWQCVVGSDFSSFFTHLPGSFIYFSLESLHFLIFKGASS